MRTRLEDGEGASCRGRRMLCSLSSPLRSFGAAGVSTVLKEQEGHDVISLRKQSAAQCEEKQRISASHASFLPSCHFRSRVASVSLSIQSYSTQELGRIPPQERHPGARSTVAPTNTSQYMIWPDNPAGTLVV